MSTKDIRHDRKRGICPMCHGKGVITKTRDGATFERRCAQCRGSGKSDGVLHRKRA